MGSSHGWLITRLANLKGSNGRGGAGVRVRRGPQRLAPCGMDRARAARAVPLGRRLCARTLVRGRGHLQPPHTSSSPHLPPSSSKVEPYPAIFIIITVHAIHINILQSRALPCNIHHHHSSRHTYQYLGRCLTSPPPGGAQRGQAEPDRGDLFPARVPSHAECEQVKPRTKPYTKPLFCERRCTFAPPPPLPAVSSLPFSAATPAPTRSLAPLRLVNRQGCGFLHTCPWPPPPPSPPPSRTSRARLVPPLRTYGTRLVPPPY
jgi:hypothetical protein